MKRFLLSIILSIYGLNPSYGQGPAEAAGGSVDTNPSCAGIIKLIAELEGAKIIAQFNLSFYPAGSPEANHAIEVIVNLTTQIFALYNSFAEMECSDCHLANAQMKELSRLFEGASAMLEGLRNSLQNLPDPFTFEQFELLWEQFDYAEGLYATLRDKILNFNWPANCVLPCFLAQHRYRVLQNLINTTTGNIAALQFVIDQYNTFFGLAPNPPPTLTLAQAQAMLAIEIANLVDYTAQQNAIVFPEGCTPTSGEYDGPPGMHP